MSEKRFFEIDYDEVYYIIDSSRLQRKKTAFEDEEEYQEYCLENSLMGTQVVDLLNSLSEENEQLRKQCFELEKDYLIETSDISDKIYLDDEIKELKQKYVLKMSEKRLVQLNHLLFFLNFFIIFPYSMGVRL